MIDKETAYAIIQNDGFLKNIDIKILKLEEGDIELEVPLKENLLRIGGIMNGAAIMTVSDTAGALCALTGEGVINEVTISISFNFARAVKKGPVKVRGKMSRNGRNIAYCKIETYDGDGVLCAEAIGNWYVTR